MEKVEINLAESVPQSEELAPAVSSKSSRLETAAFGILLAVAAFLLPIFFVPSSAVPFQFSKMILLSTGVFLAFALWILSRLKEGTFFFPNTPIVKAFAGVFLVSLLSALFSGSPLWTSFVGQILEVGTVGSLLVMLLLLFLVPILFRSKDRIFYTYLAFFAAFFLVALFHLLRLLLGPGFLSLGLFTDNTANVIGKWNDLAIFFGTAAVLSLITIELISLSRLFSWLVYAALALSLLFLALVNFSTVWYVLAIFALVFSVYIFSFDRSARHSDGDSDDQEGADARKEKARQLPVASLSLLVVSIVFIIAGGPIGNAISARFNINQIEVRPSWSATFAIAGQALRHEPLLGTGPNHFVDEWLRSKPDGINATAFWNSDFSYGVGLVPSVLVTGGVLGTLAWLLFLGLFLYTGFRAILSPINDKLSRYLVSSSFLAALFLWIMNVFYIPSPSIVALSFFFTGLFIASLSQEGIVKPRFVSFADDPRKSFISVMTLILLLIGTVALGYFFIERFIAATYFQEGVIAFNVQGNVDAAESDIVRAAALDANDMFYRFLTEIDIIRMSALLSQANGGGVSADALRTRFQSLLAAALSNAQRAETIDPTNYQNWIELGRVYEAVVPLRIQNAYESASNAYSKAFALDPKNPAILLALARLETAEGNFDKAKSYIAQALLEKNNYTDAIFLLAQIQIQQGNIKDAISSVEAASILSPNDSTVFFQLGLLRYSNKDYAGAANALEQALAITPSYANAKYFLGLSDYKLGKTDAAVAQFKDLAATNPDNQEVKLILGNIEAGKDPFANAAPPIDAQPEKRGKPPISSKGKRGTAVDSINTTVNTANTSVDSSSGSGL